MQQNHPADHHWSLDAEELPPSERPAPEQQRQLRKNDSTETPETKMKPAPATSSTENQTATKTREAQMDEATRRGSRRQEETDTKG